MDWVKLKSLIYHGRCASCNSCNWKIENIGYTVQERFVGTRKIPKQSKKCLSCYKYNVYKWWFPAIYSLMLLIPTGVAGAYYFPGQITYPTSVSPKVIFIGIPIFFFYGHLLLALINPFFRTNKIINPPPSQN